MPATRYFVDKP